MAVRREAPAGIRKILRKMSCGTKSFAP